MEQYEIHGKLTMLQLLNLGVRVTLPNGWWLEKDKRTHYLILGDPKGRRDFMWHLDNEGIEQAFIEMRCSIILNERNHRELPKT